ncbi:hypothetical protein A2Y99_04440 [Candidatus Gottesmanbacteria bacterium RBG_13_37_7]|uniref:Uncharacterized protein n=1 Tax=Candidatus Gottesmanbacteria bacterium RBG_13_37_7 TaxID=1798369 RepID=A0A1F5YGZ6_9BACT|nr:MAG: hypothetical protein A2Y99_04440 [Candidatus Gottesmanbacteria bacterium RBG_13_37_7]
MELSFPQEAFIGIAYLVFISYGLNTFCLVGIRSFNIKQIYKIISNLYIFSLKNNFNSIHGKFYKLSL